MSKKEKIAIGILMGIMLIVFAVALTLTIDIKRPIEPIETIEEIEEEIYDNSGTPRDINKVEMKFGRWDWNKDRDLEATGGTILIFDVNDYHFSYYPDRYYLQKRENDKWEMVKPKNGVRSYEDIYISPRKENMITMEIDWSKDYPELSKGMYRLVIELQDENDGNKKYEKYLYFEIIEMPIFNTATQSEKTEYWAIPQDKKTAEETEEEKERKKQSIIGGYDPSLIRPE